MRREEFGFTFPALGFFVHCATKETDSANKKLYSGS
jgi:hypothetical protein